MYVAGNPLRLRDSSGHIWDTIADVASVGYDIYDISQNGLTWSSGGALAADVVGALVPFAPAPGVCIRWCDDALQYSDEALEYGSKAANWVGDKVDEGWDAAKRAWKGNPCANSFSADTLVMTQAGRRPIAELVKGDIVLAYNEETGEIGRYPIIDTHEHLDPIIVLLTIDGERIETTPEHPFYAMASAPWLAVGELQGRWTDASDLETGDLIWQADGTTGVVQAAEVVSVEQWMYNLTVGTAHTFFVGQGGWLVHNAGPCGSFEVAKSGGRHSGWYEQALSLTANQLRKGIRSLNNQIVEHYDKIANPKNHIPNWDDLDPRQQRNLLEKKWLKDIERQQEQMDILKGILQERGN